MAETFAREVDPDLPSRYRFAGFTLSTARRVLTHSGHEVALIPRYFDLLVLLVQRRHQAVHRRDIMDMVWSDVVVSDGALSQAIRTLRRALGDDSREPLFIRTVSRHGYRFVCEAVIEEPEGQPEPAAAADPVPAASALPELVDRLFLGSEDDRRAAAEQALALDTAGALRLLDARPGHAVARALLRDARWDVPGASPVPILGQPGWAAVVFELLKLRLRHALRMAGSRWATASAGGALLGLLAGVQGGCVLLLGPGSTATATVPVALGLIGLVVGGLGAAGVGAGLAAAEAITRSWRRPALVLLGALGGGGIGGLAHLLGSWTLEGLFGRDFSPLGGGFEGLVLGGAAGLGYALATPRTGGGMATPRGAARIGVAAATGASCAIAGLWLGWNGWHLGAMSLDLMARSFPGSQVGLAPLARLLGESAPGLLTRTVISGGEGLLFGFGLALGLTHRPQPPA